MKNILIKLTIGHIFSELYITVKSFCAVSSKAVDNLHDSRKPNSVKREKLIQTLPTLVSNPHYPNAILTGVGFL